jgi:transposase
MAQRELFEEPPATGPTSAVPRGAPRLRKAVREQVGLAVVDLDTLIPEDHPARTLCAALEHLDLRLFYAPIEAREGHAGRPATDPKILVGLWLYATADGVGSARELAELCRDHAAYRWICGGVSVNHHLLAEFRVGHETALDELLSEVLGKLMAVGLVTLRRVSHDGMRVRASAGAASFRRKPRLRDFVKAARKHLADLKADASAPGQRDRREAAALRGAAERRQRVEAALGKMVEAEATKTRQKSAKDRAKAPRVSTTDPEARVMKMGDGGFRPAYNVQLSTDGDSRVIVGASVSPVGSDARLMKPALDEIARRTGTLPDEFLVDGGFGVSRRSIRPRRATSRSTRRCRGHGMGRSIHSTGSAATPTRRRSGASECATRSPRRSTRSARPPQRPPTPTYDAAAASTASSSAGSAR